MWQSLSPNQLRLTTLRLCMVSFHEMPFFREIWPRMYVVCIIDPSGPSRELLIEDAGSWKDLSRGIDSKLWWHSPMFLVRSPVVRQAVREMMMRYRQAFGWCFSDDGDFELPRWPCLNGASPWSPNAVVEEFRLRLRDLEARVVQGATRSPSFGDLVDLLLRVQ